MSKVKNTDTKPEILVRKFLFSKGFRFRVNDKRYPGTPDIVLPKYKTAIFAQGCFWHGHDNCKSAKMPETNRKFWMKKINDTKMRDRRKIEELEELGWKVINIWQCEIKTKSKRKVRLELLINEIISE